MRTFSARFVGALRLDVNVYEEVEADRTATAQAAAVVVLSSAASGVGVGIGGGVQGLILGVLVWFLAGVWMLVAFVIAVRQALDYESTWRAVAVCITGWLFYVLVGVLLIPFAR